MNLKRFAALALMLSTFWVSAQNRSKPVQGIAQKEVQVHAFVNANIHLNSKTEFKNAVLLVENDRITKVGPQVVVPKNAVIHDLNGQHIYPSFVELNSGYGVKMQPNEKGEYPVYDKANPAASYWNDAIRAQVNAADWFAVAKEDAKNMRNAGFGTTFSHHEDGIARGTGVAATLGDGAVNQELLATSDKAFFSFDKGSSSMNYPSSLMGSIALLKQAFHDAAWYANGKPKERNISLAALQKQKSGFFILKDKFDVFRAQDIAKQFNRDWIFIGGNDLYENPKAFANQNFKFVVPISLPKAYDVSDPMATAMLGMEDLKAYDWAPTNLAELERLKIDFALSASGLEKDGNLFSEIRKSIEAGLSEQQALAALTSIPANFAGIADHVGTLETGKLANFLVCSGPIFSKEHKIVDNYVRGTRYEVNAMPAVDFSGAYELRVGNKIFDLTLSADKDGFKPSISKISGTDTVKLKAQASNQGYALSISFKPSEDEGYYRLTGHKDQVGEIRGQGKNPLGETVVFAASPKQKDKDEKGAEEMERYQTVSEFSYPLKAFGFTEQPKSENILIKNATVWTNEDQGIIKGADVLLSNGRITQVGKNIAAGNATVIDGSGYHLTSGIIDEHSHIAISRGVNEGGQAISAEVSIEDVVNPEDINVYRQLAGGVTAAQLLHGSANPIGGQSALVKLKYGSSPEEMKINNADGFIKFALGENVKQSNWGDRNTERYPQTRMGVEQLYYDAFIRAKEYQRKKQLARTAAEKPRYDMELETLLEILNNKRFVSCHSYIQSEINMLMHVADSMGFAINTFTHILEGYKVADKMAAHGASGSTFSDWWAYKFEVKDAIPYNAAIMQSQGVNVGINSDDAEMGRRLNQEAAKIVKYGGVSEEEAWKMVTLNPAKMLHLDNRMGSIKVGKDADVVLWSHNPLTLEARPLYTLIEGAIYYSETQEQLNYQRDQKDRERIIKKMLEDKYDQKKKPSSAKREKMYHCDNFKHEVHAH